MSRAANKLIAAAGAGVEDTGDDDFANVVLLLDGDGTSGDANNTFTDSSTNSETITENGSVVQGSFSPYGDNWSVYTKDARLTSSTEFTTSSDFTAECWFWLDAYDSSGYNMLFSGQANNTQLYIHPDGPGLGLVMNGSTIIDASTYDAGFEKGKWHHVAWCRSSGTNRIFLDGTQVATASSTSSMGIKHVGGWRNGGYEHDGFISNARVTNTALYTSTFTPPTSPLTAVTGTALLTCQSNRFIDNSSNSYTISVGTGTPKVTPFSPFKNDDARDITTDGGSAYFNLSDAYLTYAGGNASNSTLTISFWVYVTGSMAPNNGLYPRVFNSASNAFLIYTRSDDIRIYNGGEKIQTPINKFEWHYFVAQLNGSQWEMWLDGVSKGTNTSTGSNINLSSTNYIARDETDAGYFGGYLCDFKITEGVEYSDGASFTPPTSPVSAGSSDLLLNFQDAGIYDRSGINNLDTVGNAQIDTAVKKYGTGSIEFDGSGDYLSIVPSPNLDLGTGDFTIEGWFYKTATTSFQTLASSASYYTTGANGNWILRITSATQIAFASYDGQSNEEHTEFSASTSLNTWHHFAFVREGTGTNEAKFYLDGVLAGSMTVSKSLSDGSVNGIYIGSDASGPNSDFSGYIDDFRITKGVARYTANFTPPTAAHDKF